MVGVAEIRTRLKEMGGDIGEFKEYSLGIALSGLTALCNITPEVAPFGVAAVAAAPSKNVLAAAVGASVGYLLSPQGDFNVQYLAAILLVICFRWAISIADNATLRLINPIIGGGAVIATTFIIAISEGINTYSMALVAAQGMITLASGYIFTVAMRHMGRVNVGQVGIIASITTGIIIATGSCSIVMGQLSIGRVMIVTAIASLTMLHGIYISMGATGIAMIPLLISGGGFIGLPLIIGVVIACAFRVFGRVATGIVFLTTCVAVGYFTGGNLILIPIAIETSIATLLAIIIPKSVFGEISLVAPPSGASPNLLSVAINKLNETAAALKEVASLTGQVNNYIGKTMGDESDSLYSQTADIVCRGCIKTAECWQAEFNDTMDSMGKIITAIKCGRVITADDVPRQFSIRCIQLGKMVDTLTKQTITYMGNYGTKQKLSSMRSVVTDQFEGVASLLESTATEIGLIRSVRVDTAAKITELLEGLGLSPIWAGCYEDENELKTVMVKLPIVKLRAAMESELEELIGAVLGESIVEGSITEFGDTVSIAYNPKPLFKIELAVSQRAAKGERWCGDSYCSSVKDGSAMLALSDGMGTGGEAAVDSVMTTTLLSKLYDAGVKPEAALKLINGALLAKAGEERLATVDCAVVNLYSGKAEFYKAGAAPTYTIRNGKAFTIDGAALPAGILGDITFAKSSYQMAEGDVILIVSDGVIEDSDGWVLSELKSVANKAPKEISDHILNTALQRNSSLHADDMSVIAICLELSE